MSLPNALAERALILAPLGRDGPLAAGLLKEAGYGATVCPDLASFCRELEVGAGAAIVTDQALRDADLRPLIGFLRRQPSWSDLPVILLTQRGDGVGRDPAAAQLAEALGNVIFLERPLHPANLVSAVRTALRGRRRQYEARARLQELNDLTSTLEQRVKERTAELMTEVAARERAQEQLLQSQKMESIGQLTGGVAHDFNNLLMAVMGNLQLLQKRFSADPKAQHFITGALEGAKRGAALTQRMLAFARQQDLKTGSADLATLLDGMRDLLDRTLGPQVELKFNVPQGLPPAQVDSNQIELAILNLAINARDAMPDGGTICIALDPADAVGRKGLRDGKYVRLSISDTGSGMDEATLKKAVEPFFSTKPTGKGTGLGLSMVHGLAVQLGGRLELKSELGTGTTAILWLPVAGHAPTVDIVEAPKAEAGRRATILVVDDDPLIAMSTVDMLEDLGHTVIEANSGDQALKILDNGRKIDLLLTDQAMPGMTGIELAELARQRHPAMPILLATGYTDLPTARKIDVPRLSKPYMQTELQYEIDRLLGAAE